MIVTATVYGRRTIAKTFIYFCQGGADLAAYLRDYAGILGCP